MDKITFLGPIGATFSHVAYDILAETYRAPKVSTENYSEAVSNGEILKLIHEHGGYGAIAMETLAECRVTESLESFIGLFRSSTDKKHPMHVAGAVKLKLHFCLMTRPDVSESALDHIIAHPKALGACKENVARMHLPTISVNSNGEAARLVAESDEHKSSAALGPQSAAEKYGLKIINHTFEDEEAFTTFFLIAPVSHPIALGKENRALIIFKVPHTPGSLVTALLPFHERQLNLIQIHSVQIGNREYVFAIEVEVMEHELPAFHHAMETFKHRVSEHVSFGPFEVLSR